MPCVLRVLKLEGKIWIASVSPDANYVSLYFEAANYGDSMVELLAQNAATLAKNKVARQVPVETVKFFSASGSTEQKHLVRWEELSRSCQRVRAQRFR